MARFYVNVAYAGAALIGAAGGFAVAHWTLAAAITGIAGALLDIGALIWLLRLENRP